jgi:hypothetical protein
LDRAPQVGLACLSLDASRLSWVAAEVHEMLPQLTHPETASINYQLLVKRPPGWKS